MTEYVYPAVFHANGDGTFTIYYPDLPGCISEGKNIANALYMAQDALSQWINYLKDNGADIPAPSDISRIHTEDMEFSSYVRAEIKDSRAVRRTISLPKWMDDRAAAEGLSLSRVLQDALAAKLGQ